MVVRRVMRAGAWTFFVLVSLVAAFYLVLLIVNGSDKAPSADAERFVAMARDRAPVADEANGFVHVLGLWAPPDADPIALGRERLAWLESFDRNALRASTSTTQQAFRLPGVDTNPRASRDPQAAALEKACSEAGSCRAALDADPDAPARWIASERYLVDRYGRMLSAGQWRESMPRDSGMTLPPYQPALDGQKMYLLEVREHARMQQPAEVRERLERDLVFWRTVLESSDMLITKMIAATAIERHFELGSLALRELPADHIETAVPPAWRAPLTDAERSMVRVFAGEWHFAVAGITMLTDGTPSRAEGTWERMSNRLVRPLLQTQDTLNRSAARMTRLGELSRLPYAELGPAIEQRARADAASANRWPGLYNPVGEILDIVTTDSSLTPYIQRTHDLEGLRRVALLAANLRAANVQIEQAEQAIADAPLRSPYDDTPFTWNPAENAIVFQGLQRGERGRHTVLF